MTINRVYPSSSNHIGQLGTPVTPPKPKVPDISDAANQLLAAIKADPSGELLAVRTMEGLFVQTNGVQMNTPGDPRSEAKWKATIQELVRKGLLSNGGGTGEVFTLTHDGFEYDITSL
jgi:hypothetical protein